MHHEEERRHHERHGRTGRPHPHHETEQQNFRSRWDEPTPFMHDQERRRYEQEMRARAERERHEYQQRQSDYRQHENINRHLHGFSDDHHTPYRRHEHRNWRDDGGQYSPQNQHARDRWQQQDQLPPLREQRRRHQSRPDEDWEERGW
ncbi:acyltransferase [Pontibacter indicus]|uniref:Uncharacterized protein n=1 Tax=Pontibacter indicus TaxID=1317125 RepID=A0A1R3XGE8_9BACT|nr:acyltransferase [Pontibacter indicus]SIT90458.1 hypothetical protein SAMN05444128_2297 [Pontibacter indicus]